MELIPTYKVLFFGLSIYVKISHVSLIKKFLRQYARFYSVNPSQTLLSSSTKYLFLGYTEGQIYKPWYFC